DWSYLNLGAVLLLVLSGAIGCGIGATIGLTRTLSRPILIPLRVVQDLLAYDFYVDRLYRVSVVLSVDVLSRLTSWFDRYVVDGFVNFVGIASIFSGETLKYSASGQSQVYALIVFISITVLGLFLNRSLVNGIITFLMGSSA
ncbi:MAG TPA: hypothetical protein V6D16_19370, partial [Candidatus Obscuribacterales bacterium]